MATMVKKRMSAASDLDRAREALEQRVGLAPYSPPSNPFNSPGESDTLTLARAVVELAARLEAAA